MEHDSRSRGGDEPSASAGGHVLADWDARLETALIRALVHEWEWLNRECFHRTLVRPVISLSDASSRLGQWRRDQRVLELSRRLVVTAPWGAVVEVLKHEAAHQYVHEVLRKDEAAHGPTFRVICDKLGIDARASGSFESGAPAEPTEEVAIIRRVQKLLALAQSSNQHEAENAASAAQRLMLKYNLDERAAVHDPETGARFGFRHLGTPTGRVFEHQRWLGQILEKNFFVDTIWVTVYVPLEARHGSVLEICGTPPNLAMAEYVHAFLLAAADRLWLAHKREQGIRSNRDRLRYLAGVMLGFYSKLDAQRETLAEEGLVWVPHAELGTYYRARHPRTTSIRSGGNTPNAAYESGQVAGRDLVLSRPVSGNNERAGGPRRLGPAKG